MSVATEPRIKPVRPPIINKNIKNKAKTKGGFISIEPLYMVDIQLKTLIALGTATIKVNNEKNHLACSLIPEVYI